MNRKRVRIVLTVLLFVLVSISFAGEKVAKDNGIGWDGEAYLSTIQTFSDRIFSHGYNQYDIQRVLPYGLVNVLFQAFGIKAGALKALWAAGFLSLIALGCCVLFFFKISSLVKWKTGTEIIAFSSLFYSYPILKTLGYYILQSDIFGFLMGIMLLYFFLKKNNVALLLCAVVGSFVWPVVSISALALAFLPSTSLFLDGPSDRRDSLLWRSLVCILSLLPLMTLVYSILYFHQGIMTPFRVHCPLTTPLNKYWAIVCCVCSCLYLFLAIKVFRVSITSIWNTMFNKQTYRRWGAFFLSFALISFCLRILANDEQGALTAQAAALGVVLTSMTDPFVFIESHFIYFGPLVLLILLTWKNSTKFSLSYGVGYMFVLAAGVFFSLRPESRVSVMFLPFLLFPTINYIDTVSLKNGAIWGYVILCLVVSRFWFKINVPGMEQYLTWDNYENYTKFPAQRYFMSTGHWQSHEMYLVFMSVMLVLLFILIWGVRKGWYINSQVDEMVLDY